MTSVYDIVFARMLVSGAPDLQQLTLVVFFFPSTSANTPLALVMVTLYIYVELGLWITPCMILPLEGPGCALVVGPPAPFLDVEPPSEATTSLLNVEPLSHTAASLLNVKPPSVATLLDLQTPSVATLLDLESPSVATVLDLELPAASPLLDMLVLMVGPRRIEDSSRIAACACSSSSGEMRLSSALCQPHG